MARATFWMAGNLPAALVVACKMVAYGADLGYLFMNTDRHQVNWRLWCKPDFWIAYLFFLSSYCHSKQYHYTVSTLLNAFKKRNNNVHFSSEIKHQLLRSPHDQFRIWLIFSKVNEGLEKLLVSLFSVPQSSLWRSQNIRLRTFHLPVHLKKKYPLLLIASAV